MISRVKPRWIAKNVAEVAPTTEVQPLIPQAQGTSAGALSDISCIPVGNGTPMQKASGANIIILVTIFNISGRPAQDEKMPGKNVM